MSYYETVGFVVGLGISTDLNHLPKEGYPAARRG